MTPKKRNYLIVEYFFKTASALMALLGVTEILFNFNSPPIDKFIFFMLAWFVFLLIGKLIQRKTARMR